MRFVATSLAAAAALLGLPHATAIAQLPDPAKYGAGLPSVESHSLLGYFSFIIP